MSLDRTGFKRKRFDDLFAEMEAKAKEVFGPQINTSERSPLGLILRLFAWFLARAWQNTEDVYNSGYVNSAQGVSLFKLGPYGGIQRLPATQATGKISLTGTPLFLITAGFRVSTGSVVFETTQDVTIGSGGTVIAPIRATVTGRRGNVSAGAITTIVNPNANVTACTNPEDTTGGREVESEKEFRDRFALSAEGRGAATVPSIRAALLKVPGVRAATVIENYLSVSDAAGRPPKSFEAFVLGGEPTDIGQAILNTKASGIEPYGSQSVTVKDDAGFDHIMKYTLATEVSVWLRITISTDNRFPADGHVQLKTNAISYIGGEDVDGRLFVGLNMGADVIYSRLIAAAYSVEGVTDVTVEISKDGTTWSQANLAIATNEVAQTAHDLITVVQP